MPKRIEHSSHNGQNTTVPKVITVQYQTTEHINIKGQNTTVPKNITLPYHRTEHNRTKIEITVDYITTGQNANQHQRKEQYCTKQFSTYKT